MKNSWKIYSRDMRNISKNWVAAILIGGLIVLPSLYAWFNIKASWDPYGQTDQIPIGIVNEDIGAEVEGENIDVGKELVKTLKKNKSMDWQFTTRDKAMDKVEYGDYYAVIVIPKDFSEKLTSVVSGKPRKSEMEYYVNEKINAIAPKITDKGASVIVNEISSKFISTVNGVIFEMFNDLGVELEKDLPDIQKFENYIFEMEKQLPKSYELIQDSLGDAKKAQTVIDNAQNKLPQAKDVTNQGLQTIDDTTAILSEGEKKLNEMAPKIKQDLKKAQQVASDVNNFLSDVNNVEVDFSKQEELNKLLDERVDEAIGSLATVEEALKQLKQLNNDEQNNGNQEEEQPSEAENPSGKEEQQEIIDRAITNVSTLKDALKEVQGNAQEISNFANEKKDQVNSIFNDLQELSANTNNRIGDFLTEYEEEIEPTVRKQISSAKETLKNGRSILVDIKKTIPEVERILNSTEANLSDGKDMLEYMEGQYPYVNEKINELADKIRNIQGETDINEIIQLLQNDPEAEKGFFAEPVKLNKNELFPIPNYGSGMTPFYTVLAIWVGALLLISLLATDVHDINSYTARERYYGKLFTFFSIGILQTLIVTSGDILLLDAYVAEPGWFILFGIIISLVFMSIVYTVVTVFGDVGKAMAIIMLVLQIAGAGGTYPVVLLPSFFQKINPFLPFTYAIDLMREAVGGIVWDRAIHDLLFLLLFGLAFLILGTLFKERINRQTHKLMEKSKKAGLFH